MLIENDLSCAADTEEKSSETLFGWRHGPGGLGFRLPFAVCRDYGKCTFNVTSSSAASVRTLLLFSQGLYIHPHDFSRKESQRLIRGRVSCVLLYCSVAIYRWLHVSHNPVTLLCVIYTPLEACCQEITAYLWCHVKAQCLPGATISPFCYL